MSKFSNRLKELRKNKGWSQEKLAEKLNVSRSRIGMYEQGKRQPDFEMYEAIADLFNVNLDYLFDRGQNIDYVYNLNDNEKIIIELYRNNDDDFKTHLMEYCKMLEQYKKGV